MSIAPSKRGDTDPTPAQEPSLPRGTGRKIASALRFLLVATACFVLVFGFIRPQVVEVLRVSSDSMSPTLQANDRVLASKSAYRFSKPERGDLAVFKNSQKSGEITIKRVVGLPGDTVALEDGRLSINGEPRKEPYTDRRVEDSTFYGPATVPEGHLFVLGDNRTNSVDSRFLGPVPEGDLLGKVILRLWPLNRAGPL